MFDKHYTPDTLAKAMVGAVPRNFRPESVADFAVGEGALLKSAIAKWPNIRVSANDLCGSTVSKLARNFPFWDISCSDFLSERSSSRTKYIVQAGRIDLVLINPPFSERGRARIKSTSPQCSFVSGVAMAFLWRSLAYLSVSGCLIAILPNSCLTSVRDSAAWRVIRQKYSVEIICDNPASAFEGVSASTSIVRLRAIKKGKDVVLGDLPRIQNIPIQRGRLQMHALGIAGVEGSHPLVHTSNLRHGDVIVETDQCYRSNVIFKGPGVLFPRVGHVTPEKICVFASKYEVVLSDCVLGVSCSSKSAARKLRTIILDQWDIFIKSYGGTGAPYITISRAQQILSFCGEKSKLKIQTKGGYEFLRVA